MKKNFSVVFSPFVESLKTLSDFLKREEFRKLHRLNVLFFDGNSSKEKRQAIIESFNNPDDKKSGIILVSSFAGGIGINLTGARRCILLDASWTPTVETQSICRVFRIGQKKKCFIYRLVVEGTMET